MSSPIIMREYLITSPLNFQKKPPQKDHSKKKIENLALSSIKLTNPFHESFPIKEKKITKKKEEEELKFPRENLIKLPSHEHLETRNPGDHLLLAIKNFKENTKGQILSPKIEVADSDSDVFFYESAEGMALVIKPGLPDARMSIMAQEVLKIAGLDHTVPTMKLGKIQNIKSSQDMQINYSIKKDAEGKEFAVEQSTLIPLKSNVLPKNLARLKDPFSDFYFIVKREGKKIELSLESSNDSENESDNGLNSSLNEEHWIEEFASVNFKLVQDIDGINAFLAPEAAMHAIKVDENLQKHVIRNNSLYDLNQIDAEGVYEIVGKDIPGLYQEKITHRFIGDGWGGLDITKSSSQRNSFYSRIDQYSFIDSFISFMLTRSQDGKIERLEKDSNFIFKVMDDGVKLKILQIDLDGVMPEWNDPKSDAEPHPIRCGLMGFPMVDVKISGEKLLYLKEVLQRCVTEKCEEDVLKIIEMYGKEAHDTKSESIITRHRKQAYREVIGKIRQFLGENENEDEMTLKNLFYHVFPSYKTHFELLINPPVTSKGLLPKGISPQLAALQVGAEPLAVYTNRGHF